MLSPTAAFGALVWDFQEGHLGAIGPATAQEAAARWKGLLDERRDR